MKDVTKPRGGRPGLTLEEVRAACARLEQQGRLVGPVNVRLELGRGSFTTIQRHLRALGYDPAGLAVRKKS